ERLQRVGPLAVADEDHRPALQVHHHRQVAVPLGDGDLVDGDGVQVLELGLGKAPLQVALLDVLDQVPADVEWVGPIEAGHAPRQLQDVALEGLGGALPGFGEGDLDLTDQPTGGAFDPRDGQLHGGGPAADGQATEAAALGAAGDDIAAAAGGAAAVGRVLS